jgi:hypothetical protein
MGQKLQQILSEYVLCKASTAIGLLSQDISEISDRRSSSRPDCPYFLFWTKVGTPRDKREQGSKPQKLLKVKQRIL